MRRVGPLAALAAAVSLASASAGALPAVWTLKGPRATILLFGSVHLLPAGLDWRPPALDAALASAETLWFEIPIGEATDMTALRLSTSRGLLPRGDSLFAHLTPDQSDRLHRAAASLGVNTSMLAPMRPWLAEVTLALADDARAGALASQGVEDQVQSSAPLTARRRAFETADEQISFLADAPLADQAAALDETLKEIEDEPDSYQAVVRAWMAGDLAALDAQALAPLRLAAPAVYARLITDRNRRWAKIIEGRLRGRGRSVVIVGVGHLIGPGGVPALLRAAGVTVEGP